jgi:hypothetical protein
MAGNASSKKAKKSEPEYSLGYDADGNVVLVPNKPDTSPARSPFSRISEGAMEGYGYQPLGMSDESLAKYPTAGRYLNPVAKALDAVRRAPGAAAGALAGTAGAGAELWTGDRGVANEAQRGVASMLEYGGNQGMATMGGPRPRSVAPTAPPRYNVNPATDYRQAVNLDYGVKPRVPYDKNPVVDQTFVPREQVRTVNEVQGTPTSSQRLNTESPRADVQLGNRQTAARNELSWQNLMDEMRASGEGMPERLARVDMPKVNVSPAVQLAQAKVAGRTLTPAEVGGSTSPFLTNPAPGIKRRAAPEAPPVEAALRARETQMAPAEYPVRAPFSVADPRMMNAAELQGARSAFAGPNMPLMQLPKYDRTPLGVLGGGSAAALALKSGADQAQEAQQAAAMRARDAIDASEARASGAEVADLAARNREDYSQFSDYGDPTKMFEGNYANFQQYGSPAAPEQRYSGTETAGMPMAPKAAAAVAAAKAQAPRGGKTSINQGQPIDLTSGPSKAPSGGFLSGLFANRPASTADLYRQSQADPGDSGAYMRAERQYAATHKDNPNFDLTKLDEKGMARGGAANASPTKEALLHKSLEIIHHMLRSR